MSVDAEPLRPGDNPLADQLIEENTRLRRERNEWMAVARRLFVYCQQIVGHDDRGQPIWCKKKAVSGTGLCPDHSDGEEHPMGRPDHVHFRGDEPHSHDPYIHPWGSHEATQSDGTTDDD